MIITNAEAIKTLEALKRHSEHVVRLNKDHDKVFDDDVNALTLAIDALRVVEWLEKNPGVPLGYFSQWKEFPAVWCLVNRMKAPTLSELAAKLREKA